MNIFSFLLGIKWFFCPPLASFPAVIYMYACMYVLLIKAFFSLLTCVFLFNLCRITQGAMPKVALSQIEEAWADLASVTFVQSTKIPHNPLALSILDWKAATLLIGLSCTAAQCWSHKVTQSINSMAFPDICTLMLLWSKRSECWANNHLHRLQNFFVQKGTFP